MMPAQFGSRVGSLSGSLLGSILCLTLVTGGQPELAVTPVGDAVEFRVSGPDEPFVGVVLGSMSSATMHFLVDLPPLLSDAVVLGFGAGDERNGYAVQVPVSMLPERRHLFAQGVTLVNGVLQSSDVVAFTVAR